MTADSNLTILNVNSHSIYGGAERVVTSLHLEYLQRGLDSWLVVGKADGSIEHLIEMPPSMPRHALSRFAAGRANAIARLSRRPLDLAWLASRSLRVVAEPARYRRIAKGFEDFDFPSTASLLDLTPRRPDVMHLHNLHGSYFDLRELPSLTKAVPTIATLHDAWLLTGHCVHPFECERWKSGCGRCPSLKSYVPIAADQSAENFRVKRDLLAASKLRIATPSKWLMGLVDQSPMADSFVERRVIPNGVDTSVFTPGSRSEARSSLGLPQDASIVLFSARNVETSPYKDFETLVAALSSVSARHGEDLLLVTLGAVTSDRLRGMANIHPVPFVKDPAQVAEYYRAADLYVHAAKAENAPLAIIEAMACATPVVATNVGGIPELIANEETGLLVEPGSCEGLASAIESLLTDPALARSLAGRAAEKAAGELSLERQADAYIAWYEELSAS